MQASGINDDDAHVVAFLVPKHLVKTVKTAIDAEGKAHGRLKVRRITSDDDVGHLVDDAAEYFIVFSSFVSSDISGQDVGLVEACALLEKLGVQDQVVVATLPLLDQRGSGNEKISPFALAVRQWAQEQRQHRDPMSLTRDPPRHTIYGSMLMLPPSDTLPPAWQDIVTAGETDTIQRLFELIVQHLKVTHMAINAPIPLQTDTSSLGPGDRPDDNILRSPSNLVPLYGDFGPLCTKSSPTIADFDAAYWTTTKQNGIHQVWAPRYTMFSRGNITEKARILYLPSVQQAVWEGRQSGKGCTAVDLYAGIGYFTFSYAAAGASKVLCWDINPWSIEGLRRGAVENRWGVIAAAEGVEEVPVKSEDIARILTYLESNEHALSRIESMRNHLPPIRHVNCGLLPSSGGSWETAVRSLDPILGGWIHLHENLLLAEVDEKADAIRQEIEHLHMQQMKERQGTATQDMTKIVRLEHVQRVKSYAPGVFHFVLDIYIGPSTE